MAHAKNARPGPGAAAGAINRNCVQIASDQEMGVNRSPSIAASAGATDGSWDGLLDGLDHPILDFFADRRIANVDDRKKAITIQNLLDMTSGLDWDQGFEGGKQQTMQDMYRASNLVQFILDRPMAHSPGEVFNYSNGNPDLISAIITRLTGKPLEDYAREKLFAPLGIADWHWDRDPQDLTIGDGMLFLLPRDMAKIGYLYLHHGEWAGRQLLPSGWADVLSHTIVNTHASYDPSLSYSNFFWILPERHVYMANGKDGLPTHD